MEVDTTIPWDSCGNSLLLYAPFSDSVWTYHAKALTCESLFTAKFTNEKFWSGTHPEYPLLMPFLHSYFFSLMNSFRDDWIKIWQVGLIISFFRICYREILELTKKEIFSVAAFVIVLTWIVSQTIDARVEMNTLIFVSLASLCLLSCQFYRLPLYLFALVFSKNEGLPLVLLFIGLHGIFLLLKRNVRDIRYVLPLGIGIIMWVLVQSQLPSHHEQYPSQLTSIESWKNGSENFPLILKNVGIVMSDWPWLPGLSSFFSE